MGLGVWNSRLSFGTVVWIGCKADWLGVSPGVPPTAFGKNRPFSSRRLTILCIKRLADNVRHRHEKRQLLVGYGFRIKPRQNFPMRCPRTQHQSQAFLSLVIAGFSTGCESRENPTSRSNSGLFADSTGKTFAHLRADGADLFCWFAASTSLW